MGHSNEFWGLLKEVWIDYELSSNKIWVKSFYETYDDENKIADTSEKITTFFFRKFCVKFWKSFLFLGSFKENSSKFSYIFLKKLVDGSDEFRELWWKSE